MSCRLHFDCANGLASDLISIGGVKSRSIFEHTTPRLYQFKGATLTCLRRCGTPGDDLRPRSH
jgi:hypothetical protein